MERRAGNPRSSHREPDGRSPAPGRRRTPRKRSGRPVAAVTATLAVVASLLGTLGVATPVQGAVAPVGQGFTVTAGDLSYILKQIKISERHAATRTASNPCGTLVGSAANQIPDRLTAYGLRTVDGSCNNLFPGRETFAAADRAVPPADDAEVQGSRGRGRRLLRPRQPRRRGQLLRPEEG